MSENKKENQIDIENTVREYDYSLIGSLSIKASSKEEADKILEVLMKSLRAVALVSESDNKNILTIHGMNTDYNCAYEVKDSSSSVDSLSKIECNKTGCEFNSAKCSHCKTGFCSKKDVVINEDRGNTFCKSFNFIKEKYYNPCDSHLVK